MLGPRPERDSGPRMRGHPHSDFEREPCCIVRRIDTPCAAARRTVSRSRSRRQRSRLWAADRGYLRGVGTLRVGCLLLLAVTLVGLSPTANAAPTRKKAIWGPVQVDGVSQFPIYRDLGVGIFQIRLGWDSVEFLPRWMPVG